MDELIRQLRSDRDEAKAKKEKARALGSAEWKYWDGVRDQAALTLGYVREAKRRMAERELAWDVQ